MSGPWENYQSAAPSGPWAKYAPAPSTYDDPRLETQRRNLGDDGPWPDVIPEPPRRTVGAAMSVNNPPPKIDVGPPTAQMPTPGRSWSDVPGEALSNAPASAGNFLSAVVQPIIHPVDTATALYDLGKGVVSKLRPVEPGQEASTGYKTQRKPLERAPSSPEAIRQRTETEAPADAVGAFFADRYGSEEGLKNALATDPVGVAADVATVLTGGGALAARAPGVVGKAGQIVSRAGAAVDPLTQTGNVLKLGAAGAEKVAANTLGITTGAGPESIRAAGRAGREGGEAATAFTANMRGDVPVDQIVDLAKSALEKIRKERGDAYKAGKADLSKDKTVLDFQPIEDAVTKANDIGAYKGVVVNRKAGGAVDEINGIVSEWKALDPAEYHTPEGLDALKRSIGDLRDSTEYGSPARVAADRVYNAVKGEIEKQAPAYSKMMEDYARASDKLKEVTKTFSLGEKATGETAARKLQAATRDGAQTSWRNRGELLNELATHEPTLPYAIAGQSTNALAPRGLVGRGGLMASIATNPANALAAPAFSPRIVGEVVYMGGKAVGGVDEVARALKIDADTLRAMGQGSFQAGRADDIRSRAVTHRNALGAR